MWKKENTSKQNIREHSFEAHNISTAPNPAEAEAIIVLVKYSYSSPWRPLRPGSGDHQ